LAGPETGGCAVDIRGLGFAYPGGGREALQGLDWHIPAGARVGLLGASGAGKSTLLLHLNGILQARAGTVSIGGTVVSEATLATIRRDVGLVFQNPDDQLFHLSVEEDIAFGPRNLGWSEPRVHEAVHAAAAALRIEGLLGQHPQQLSSGEKKRAALATVLAMRPRVVALDEPFANLDPSLIEQLIGIIQGLEATVVVVSQAILPALACCPALAVLEDGRIAAEGPALDIARDRALLRRCGLDFHYFRDIWRRLEQAGS
jgi:cobalt/nickel transport system ATP-binding protein